MPSAMAVASEGKEKDAQKQEALTFHNKPSANNNHNDNNENWNDNGCSYGGAS